MKIIKNYLCTFLALVMVFAFSSCSKTQPIDKSRGDNKVELTVSAAASLKDAMNELKDIYSKENGNVNITYNFGASGSLQQQIENGADVDIFISAGVKQMDALKDKSLLLDETRKNLIGNEIVMVVPSDSSLNVDFNGLNFDKIKKLALGEPGSVPAGQYAEEVFIKFNVLEKVKSKVVYAKDVREVLSWVETGNADAGVVYKSDAIQSKKVKEICAAPEGSHKPIVYPASVIKASKNTKEARAFLDFLSSDKAKSVFEKYGFIFIR